MALWIFLLVLLSQIGNLDAATTDLTNVPDDGTTLVPSDTTTEPPTEPPTDNTGEPDNNTTGGGPADTTEPVTTDEPSSTLTPEPETTDEPSSTLTPEPETTQDPEPACPTDVHTCKDGSKLDRVPADDCKFPACPTTKQVKFDFKADITKDQFTAKKDQMTEEVATLFSVHKSVVTLALKAAGRLRRLLNEGVDIEVTVKAEDEAEATKISNKVKESSFKTDLASSLSKAVETTVVVASVSEPQTMNIDPAKTTEEPEEEKSYTVIIVVVVLCVVLLGVGVFAYFKLNSDKAGFFDNELEMQH